MSPGNSATAPAQKEEHRPKVHLKQKGWGVRARHADKNTEEKLENPLQFDWTEEDEGLGKDAYPKSPLVTGSSKSPFS